MKVQTIDTKRRLVLPGATPGECYAVREAAPQGPYTRESSCSR